MYEEWMGYLLAQSYMYDLEDDDNKESFPGRSGRRQTPKDPMEELIEEEFEKELEKEFYEDDDESDDDDNYVNSWT